MVCSLLNPCPPAPFPGVVWFIGTIIIVYIIFELLLKR